jgi:pentatricopeptide repeat protein
VTWLYRKMIVARISLKTFTFNLLICALCDSGRLEEAHEVFDRMSEEGCPPNVFSVAILVRGYCRAGPTTQGFRAFK